MERELIGIYSLLALLALIMLRIPVALAMLVTGVVGTFILSLASPFIKFGPYLLQLKTAIWNSVANTDLSVLPLVLLMGFLAVETGRSRDLFQGLSALTRRVKGGVAVATILACAGFGAVSGSSIATAPALAPMSDSEVSYAIRRLLSAGLIFGTIILGLGLFTPTPAAGGGVFMIFAYGMILRGLSNSDGLTFGRLKVALLATAKRASMIYFILFSADILKGFFARTNLPTALSDWAAASTLEPYTILLAMLVILILLPGLTLFPTRVL